MAFVVTAIVAVEAAVAVTTIATVLAAVAAVGTAITVVGVITGNKDMIKIGGVMSIVGGVGGFIAGAAGGAAGAGASAAESGAGDAAAGAAGDAAVNGAGEAAASAGGDATLDGMGNVVGTGADTGAVASAVADPAAGITTGALDSTATYAPGTYAPEGFKTATMGDSASAAFDNPGYNMNASPASNAGGYVDPTAATAPTNSILGGASSGGDGYLSGNAQTSVNSYTGGAPSPGIIDSLKTKFGNVWDSMSQDTKNMLIKQALSIPGGIQDQKNKDRQFDQNQQAIDQHSYGSAVPTVGIIQRAGKK